MDKVREQILLDLYNRAILDEQRYELDEMNQRLRESELAMHLYGLRKSGLIWFEEDRPMAVGGSPTKYKNRVFSVLYPEEIFIRPKGIKYILDKRMKPIDKFTRTSKIFSAYIILIIIILLILRAF